MGHKRDRIQVIAEILNLCKNPQTQTGIRRQTNISYLVLQNCIMQLLIRQWLIQVDERCGQKKLALTQKGTVFLCKWLELQKLTNTADKNTRHKPRTLNGC